MLITTTKDGQQSLKLCTRRLKAISNCTIPESSSMLHSLHARDCVCRLSLSFSDGKSLVLNKGEIEPTPRPGLYGVRAQSTVIAFLKALSRYPRHIATLALVQGHGLDSSVRTLTMLYTYIVTLEHASRSIVDFQGLMISEPSFSCYCRCYPGQVLHRFRLCCRLSHLLAVCITGDLAASRGRARGC